MSPTDHASRAVEPVRRLATDTHEQPGGGVGLCLSGGGYRAMLFHVGALWRLNETGWLGRLDRVSSVSGGSITAATLGLRWAELTFTDGIARNFDEQLVAPVRALARHTIDERAIAVGLLTPASIGERVAAAYRDRIFGDATLQELPDEPRFVINATNLASGALVRFSRPYLADWRVGRIDAPAVALADAVAASSAFPPVLSPFELDLGDAPWRTVAGNDLTGDEYRGTLTLSDGGVYDNLGLETAYKRCRTLLVSDAGGQLADEPDPPNDWARQSVRVLKVVDNQVRELRKRQLLAALTGAGPDGRRLREGAYWGIRSDIAHYELRDALPCPHERTLELARTPTRLKALPDEHQERLINWGFAVCDAALRRWVDPALSPPAGFPYEDAGV